MPREPKTSCRTKDERIRSCGVKYGGFAVIGFLVALPVLLAFVCVVAAAALLLKADTERSLTCDSKSYQTEADLAAAMNKLLSLNPRARSLIRQRKVAERCLQTAPTPPTQAICSAELAAVTTAQGFLAAEQQAIIIKANIDSLAGTSKLRSSLSGTSPSFTTPSLQVEAKEKDELAPEYEARSNIERAEKLNVDYRLSLASADSTILRLLIYRGPISLKRSCAATITKRGSKYFAQMANGVRL